MSERQGQAISWLPGPTDRGRRQLAADGRLLNEIHDRNISGVEALLATGQASVDGSGGVLIQPIALAANLGQADMIELLHERGADLEASAPRDIFDKAGNQSYRKSWRPLHGAVRGGKAASLHALLKAGANPNGTDAESVTPLMTASKDLVEGDGRRRYPLVQALLAGGADPTLVDENGRSALHYAAKCGDTEVMGALLRRAPSMLNNPDSRGCTALSYASTMGHCTAVSYLLSAGANEKALLPETSVSALVFAIHAGHDDVVRLLANEGIEAVGGPSVIRDALAKRATTLRILLAAHARAGVNCKNWVNEKVGGLPFLHYAVGFTAVFPW